MKTKIILPPETNGMRLDQALASQIPQLSRSQLQRMLREGRVLVDNQPGRAAQKVDASQHVVLDMPASEPSQPLPLPLKLDILHEDQHLIIINKSAGMVVHPAPGHMQGTLVHGLLHHCREMAGLGDIMRPGIVHRLDKDTSGALVAAKDEPTYLGLIKAFSSGAVEKEYLALVWGHPPRQGSIDKPIGRHPVDRKRMSTRNKTGKPALSKWRVLNYYHGPVSLLAVTIATGRTHQIRVHLSEAGFPLLGDALYAPKKARLSLPGLSLKAPRQMLHAHVLSFIHPVSAAPIGVTAPLAQDMQGIITQLEPFKICSEQR